MNTSPASTRTRVTVDGFFKADGIIAGAKPGFRPRVGQAELSQLILDQLAAEGHVMAEGPTGFGKSLSLLTPVICAILNGDIRRAVVSTETIALQDQYTGIDLPMLQEAVYKALGRTFTFATAKGRGNLACKAKLPYDEMGGGFKTAGMTPLQMWVTKQVVGKDSGDRASVPDDLGLSEKDWYEVGADDDCERRGCPFYGQGQNPNGSTECFVYEARKRFITAQIVVTNHTLLLLDRANVTREAPAGPLLSDEGGFDMLVVDEAHTLPEKAQNTWGYEVSPRTLSVTVRGVARMFRRSGLDPFGDDYLERWQKTEEAIFAPFEAHVGKSVPLDDLPSRDVDVAKTAAEIAMAALRDQLKTIRRELRDVDTVPEEKKLDLAKSATERLGRVYKALDSIFVQNGSDQEEIDADPSMADNWLSFIETATSQKGQHVKLKVKPIEVGPLMRVKLFDTIKTVVVASATLRVKESFYFPRTRMGVPKDRTREFVGTTPFDFREAVEGYFPTNLPAPPTMSSPNYHRELPLYREATAARIADLIEHTGGGALILFTSKRGMEDAFFDVRDELSRRKYRGSNGRPLDLMMQGDQAKHSLVRRMKSDRDSCLFATKSFFTGVDIPGDALRLLILMRAPFPVPSDPMFAAQCRRIKERGGSDFRDLSLPLMLMDLLQGFGRLIRTVDDKGTFALLDSRANSKGYGRDIRAALPSMRVLSLPADRSVPRPGEEDEE